MVVVGYNGVPIRIGEVIKSMCIHPGFSVFLLSLQAWTFKCRDGMKFETDASQDSFEVECREDDTFEPADYSTWPKCRACEIIFRQNSRSSNLDRKSNPIFNLAKKCDGDGLPPPPAGGSTRLLSRGLRFGNCLGVGGSFEAAPSCPGKRVN